MTHDVRQIKSRIGRIWAGKPFQMDTDLSIHETERRLSQTRHQTGRMIILLKRGRGEFDYRLIALKRGRSNGLQRFLFCTLTPRGKGTRVAGVIRTRTTARWWMNYSFSFLLTLQAGTLIATIVQVLQGHPNTALITLMHSLMVALMGVFYLGFCYVSMAETEPNEDYLIEWLNQRLR